MSNLEKLLFSKATRQILLEISKAHSSSRQISLRAKIVLVAGENLDNQQIAKKLQVSRKCVGKWRQEWIHSSEASVAIEATCPI